MFSGLDADEGMFVPEFGTWTYHLKNK